MNRLLLVFLSIIPTVGFGQVCTIDYTETQPGIYPDTMPTGYVNQFYDEDITFVMPTDTQGFDFTNFHILSIGLPVGLSWECSNSGNGCNYDPQVDPYGCVRVYGTPLLAGQYQVDVTVIADLTVVQGVPTTFSVFLEILPNNVPTSNNGFAMTGANGCAPQQVQFTNNNPGMLAYNWDFGNGNTSTLENPPPQVYPGPGQYIVNYEAYTSLDTINVYTLTSVTIHSMSGYEGGFPLFDNADAYFIINENGNLFNQSSIITDTDPPVSWTTSMLLDENNTYTIDIWEDDSDPLEFLYGANDFIGSATINLNGCSFCTAGDATISYTIDHQIIYPSPSIVSVDTVNVSPFPVAPPISYDSIPHTLSAPDYGDSYQWYFNGSPVAGATDTSHVVQMSGYYHLAAINSAGCVAFSDTVLAIYCDTAYVPEIELNNDNNLVVTNSNGNDIQWYLDGNVLADDTLQITVPGSTGSYYVQLTDPFGCVFVSDPMSVAVGLDELHQVQWSFYPNPATNTLHVQLGDQSTVDGLSIVDLQGRKVLEQGIENPITIIDLSRIQAGQYLVCLSHNDRLLEIRPLVVHK